jgi:ATP/maltotriose-dependent transcriptional regulator MalT
MRQLSFTIALASSLACNLTLNSVARAQGAAPQAPDAAPPGNTPAEPPKEPPAAPKDAAADESEAEAGDAEAEKEAAEAEAAEKAAAEAAEAEAAEALYREAIERFSRTPRRPELARSHLVYGEWLRNEARLGEAREQLRTAEEMFADIGMEGFAERARSELVAAGAKRRKRSLEPREELTPQEEQIAGLARDGLSNAEIGTQLFLSPRTVEWHLRKIFDKLSISSRRQLRNALPRTDYEAATG